MNRSGTNYAGNRPAGREPNVKAIEDMYARQRGVATYTGAKGYNDFREFLQHKDRTRW